MDNSLIFSINLNGTAYKGTVKLDAAMEKLTASVKKTESAMGGLITRSVGLEAIASLATRAFNAVAAPMKKMIDVGSESELQLQNMISLYKGNADAAQDMYSRLSEFGRTTVYDKKSLIDAQKTMMSFGISGEKAYNTLRQIGDIAMGDSQKMKSLALAFSQATSAGKLGGQDLLQLINAGFNPLQTISERTGKSMATLKDEMGRGLITADDLARAFKWATEEGSLFYKGAERAGTTTAGRLNQLHDGIDALFIQTFNRLKPIIDRIIDTVAAAIEKVPSIVERLIQPFRAGFEQIKSIFQNLSAMSGAFSTVLTVVTGIIAVAFNAVTTAIHAVTAALSAVVGFAQNCPVVFWSLAGAVGAVAIAMNKARISAIAQEVALNALIVKEQVATFWSKALATAVKSIKAGKSILTTTAHVVNLGISAITSGAAFKAMQEVAVGACRVISTAVMSIPIVGWIAAGITAVVAAIKLLWDKCEGFRVVVMGIWEVIKTVFGYVWQFIKNYFIKAFDDLKTKWEWLKNGVLAIVDWLTSIPEKITSAFSSIEGWFSGVFAKAKLLVASFVDWFMSIPSTITAAFMQFFDSVKAAFTSVFDWLTSIPEKITSAFSSIEGWFSGVFDTIEGKILSVVDTVRSAVSSVYNWINDKIFSPIVDFFSNLYSKYIKPLLDKIVGFMGKIFNPIIKLWNKITGKVADAYEVGAQRGHESWAADHQTAPANSTNAQLAEAVNAPLRTAQTGTAQTGIATTAAKGTQAVATGGSKQTTINITLGKFFENIVYNDGGATDNATDTERQFVQLMNRVLGMAANAV